MCQYCGTSPCPPRCPGYDTERNREIIAHCPICNEPVREGDDAYKLPDGTIYHAECFDDEYRWTAE